MNDTLSTTFDQTSFDAFIASRDEPNWLKERRRVAWKRFQELVWPDRRHEEWLRTDIRLFKLEDFQLAPEPAPAIDVPAALLAEGVPLAGQSVAVNGTSVNGRLDPKWAAKGVVFGSLDRLVSERADVLQGRLGRAVDGTLDRFAALHAACWSGSHVLYVPRGVVIDEPLHMHSVLTRGHADVGHVLVILDDGAEATVLAETASAGDQSEQNTGLHCGAVELLLGAGSNLRYVNLQDWSHGVWHFAQQKAIVDRGASLQWTIAALGARLAKVNQHVALVGTDSRCQVNGVMFTEGRQHLSYHTLQHHASPHTTSDFLYKAALQDKSRTVWRGMIKVDPLALKTDGYQRNDNLLLSPHARADSIPGLEIQADDVRCTHGSTTGRIDDELLFYAQCRGFTRREAARAIVTGFFQQVFDRITIESVREALGRAIVRRVREYE